MSGLTGGGSGKGVSGELGKIGEEKDGRGEGFEIGVIRGGCRGDCCEGMLRGGEGIKFGGGYRSNRDLGKGVNKGEMNYREIEV